jgi:hypothetical protein
MTDSRNLVNLALHSHTRELGEPYNKLACALRGGGIPKLTSINFLANEILNSALSCSSHRLFCDSTAAIVEALRFGHGFLELVALPAEHVIGMGARSSSLKAPYERVLGTRWPHAVELGRIPSRLVSHLWDTDGVT